MMGKMEKLAWGLASKNIENHIANLAQWWNCRHWSCHWMLDTRNPALLQTTALTSPGVASGWQFDWATMLPWKLSAFAVSYAGKTASELQAESIITLATSQLEHLIDEGWSCVCGIVTRESRNDLSSDFYLGDRNLLCHISPNCQRLLKRQWTATPKNLQTS